MKCRICGNTESNRVFEAREMMFGFRDVFTYFQCSSCRCLQIEHIPSNIAKYYPQDYNGYALPKKHYFGGIKGWLRRLRYESSLFRQDGLQQFIDLLLPAEQYHILSKVPVKKDSRILDIGCGMGWFLYPLYEMGMHYVQGADPFIPSSITYPNGYQVTKSFIHEVKGSWDVIIYNHSFEHVPDPLENLQSVARLLAPRGTCIIRIPTVSSFAWEHYQTNWFQLDAPRHFYLHSIESMRLLAKKAGFLITDIIYDSNEAQFIQSEKYILDIPLNTNSPRTLGTFFKRKFDKWRFKKKAKQLNAQNKGDQAAFFLKRENTN